MFYDETQATLACEEEPSFLISGNEKFIETRTFFNN